MRVWLGAACLLALGLRALGFEWVFVDPETVVFAPGDAQYHLRRALYAWTAFPSLLFSDSYINHPDGAAISWPPLYDFAVAAIGRVLARGPHAFEVLAAWIPPFVGAATVLPVYALGRRVGGPGVGLGAGVLLALLPIHVNYSRVGQLDHHCAVAAVGACLLLVVARLAAGDGGSFRLGAALAVARLALLLTWHGSLLYLGLVEATLWIAAAVTGRRSLYVAQATSALATWVVLAPLVWLFPEPLGGAWSAIALSRLHVLAVGLVVVVSAGMAWLEARTAGRSPLARLVWTAGLGAGAVAVVLALPAVREGLEPGLRFLTMSDGVGRRTGEQLPLFVGFGRPTGRPVWEVWGLLGYGIPLLPFLIPWACPREKRAFAWVLAGWAAFFGVLAVSQRRYGNDLAPVAAVGTALVLAAAGRAVAARAPRIPSAVVATGLGALLLAPPLVQQYPPRLESGLLQLRGGYAGRDRAVLTVAGSLTRFMQQVRRVTPETSGYFDVARKPEYGIVAHANLGHAIQNVAHRPTPTDPFWAFIGRTNWARAFALLAAESESEAVELARRLDARYVITFSSADPATFEGWLHHATGARASARPATGHFRLIVEGPDGAAHFARSFQMRGGRAVARESPPYRLFERVEGAVIEVSAPDGEEVRVGLGLRAQGGRRLAYDARATASSGVARIRVPYATSAPESGEAVAAEGPYRVETPSGIRAVAVAEADVRGGRVIRVPAGPAAAAGAASGLPPEDVSNRTRNLPP